MPKSQIIKDIVEERVGIEQSLNRLYILALDVKNKELAYWAEKELNGYTSTDELPSYRKADGATLRYSGINGGFQVTNQPLQPSFIKQEHRDIINNIQMREGIRFLSELASSEQPATRDLSVLAHDVLESSGGQVQCISIEQIIPQSVFQGACAEVKHKMLQALVELESKYGNLDSLGIDISAKKPEQIVADNAEINRMVLNINMTTPDPPKEKMSSKILWKFIIPIITAVIGVVVGAVLVAYFGLG